jgi:hypothetical protein
VRHRPARQPGAGAARDDRHAELVTGTQHVDDLASLSGRQTASGSSRIGGEAVALVGAQVFVVDQQAVRRQDRPQARDEDGAVGGEGGFGIVIGSF